jgi:hypothetical protein
MKDLTKELQSVFDAPDRMSKIKAMSDLINASHAKKNTKILALQKIVHLSCERIDSFAANYMLSGDGMKIS